MHLIYIEKDPYVQAASQKYSKTYWKTIVTGLGIISIIRNRIVLIIFLFRKFYYFLRVYPYRKFELYWS